MFAILPEPEFSAWFESLPEPQAEEVTTALELLATAGSVLEPAILSPTLLWFDGTLGMTADPMLQLVQTESVRYVVEFLSWHRQVISTLESSLFRARLSRVAPPIADETIAAVEQLKRQLRASSVQTILVRSLRERESIEHRRSKFEKAFFRMLSLLGLRPESLSDSQHGLRDLTITNTTPQLRVLLGLDAKNERLLPIFGEPLTRSYYGDSVRWAEARWARYCDSADVVHAP